MAALADAVESVAGRHHPGVGCRPLQIPAEVFEDRWIVRGHGGKVIEGLVYTGGETGRGHIVTQNAAIDHLAEERSAGNQFLQQVRDVFLPLGHEGFLVTGSPAEGDHDYFAVARPRHEAPRGESGQRAAHARTGNCTQEVAAAPGDRSRNL